MRSDIGESRQLESVFERARPELVYNLAGEFGRRNGEDFYGDYEGTMSEDVPERVPIRQRGELHEMKVVSDLVLEALGCDDSHVTYRDSEPMTTKDKVVDTARAIADLDHAPRVSLEDGIPLTVEWMRRVYRVDGPVLPPDVLTPPR